MTIDRTAAIQWRADQIAWWSTKSHHSNEIQSAEESRAYARGVIDMLRAQIRALRSLPVDASQDDLAAAAEVSS